MADDIAVTQGTGTSVATDEIGGRHFQRIKLSVGGDGVAADADGDKGAASAATLRVAVANDDTNLSRLLTASGPVAPGLTPAPTTMFLLGAKYTLGGVSFVDGATGALQSNSAGHLLTAIDSIPAGENFIGRSGGVIERASANFTRPADTTAYAVGDLIANSVTAGSVVLLSFNVARVAAGSGMIRRARLRKSGTSITNALFRLHLFNAVPATITNGDNGALLTSGAADYIGAIDINVDRAFADGAAGNGVPMIGSEINFKLASGTTVRGVIEARGAYTPVSGETFTIDLEVIQN